MEKVYSLSLQTHFYCIDIFAAADLTFAQSSFGGLSRGAAAAAFGLRVALQDFAEGFASAP